MALTAFPTVRVNTASASADDAASGAGPATAITGTMLVSTNSTTISFSGTPDLSGVAEDGTHTVLIDGLGYVRISTRDNAAKTAVVETAISITAGTKFAIGGTIPSLNGSNARKLFAATAGPTTNFGASGRWTIDLESDDSISSAMTLSFTAGTGKLIVQSSSSSARRQFTQTGNATHFTCNTANRIEFQRVQFRNSNATKQAVFTTTAGIVIVLRDCIAGAADGTDCPLHCVLWSSGSAVHLAFYDTAVIRCTSHGLTPFANTLRMVGCDISRNGGSGINFTSGGSIDAYQTVISHNTSFGVNSAAAVNIARNCTISDNGNTGWRNNGGGPDVTMVNNQFTRNAGWGLQVTTAMTSQSKIEFNNFGNASDSSANTSGSATLPAADTFSATNITLASGYTDTAIGVRNYAVGSLMKAAGHPVSSRTIGAGQSGTFSFVDIGAAQREEPAAAGTPAFVAFG